MIKANIYFETFDDSSLAILNDIRRDRLPVKIWLPCDDMGYRTKYHTRDIDTISHPATNAKVTCYTWDIATASAHPMYNGIQHLPTHINLSGRKFISIRIPAPARHFTILFQDCVHEPEYPSGFFKIPTFDNYHSLKEYIKSLPYIFELSNNPNFRKTALTQQGKPVYLETAAKRYWHMDNLHKNHYEVYDHNGNHIGEADLDGHLHSYKADNNKHLPL